MGIISKNRKDAKWVKPKDSIQAIVPYIMPKRTEAEVSSTSIIDVTELCKYVDEKNEKETLNFKMTYFHALLACFGMTVYNRKALNRFIKNKKLYQRNKITFAFIAKNKMKDNGEEKIVSIDLNPDENALQLSKRVAVDIFEVKKQGTNSFDKILSFFTSMPKWILTIVFGIVKFLDKHGINPKIITEGYTNYATILLSNLGSIKTNSCYHHLNEYGTNSIVITIGTIKEENGRKTVDITSTIDERIADGFYFAKSIKLVQYIALHPELLDKKISTIINYDE